MLKQKIVDEQIQALKNRKQEKLSTLRYILAQIKNKEIEKRSFDSTQDKSDLIDDEVILVLRKIAKELNESIDAAELGNRQDLVLQYQKQLEILNAYLPKEMSNEDLKKEIDKIISENQELFNNNPKAIIGLCVKNLKNKADPSRIVKILQIIIKK